eukprot:m.13417 g.13417  ORF g.13417 m.13417 type:complete len:64 (+) comp10109_c0_seq1:702-893(+)
MTQCEHGVLFSTETTLDKFKEYLHREWSPLSINSYLRGQRGLSRQTTTDPCARLPSKLEHRVP